MRPHPRPAAEPPISTFRARILGGNRAPLNAREIWREIEIAANQSLAELGEAIPLAFAIESACPWSFSLTGPVSDSAVLIEYAPREGLPAVLEHRHPYDPARVLLRDVPLPGATGRREFLLRLDDGSWVFGVKLIEQSPMAESHLRYPRVVAGSGSVGELAASAGGSRGGMVVLDPARDGAAASSM